MRVLLHSYIKPSIARAADYTNHNLRTHNHIYGNEGGWESAFDTAARTARCAELLREVSAERPSGDVVLWFGHGASMGLLLASLLGAPSTTGARFDCVAFRL